MGYGQRSGTWVQSGQATSGLAKAMFVPFSSGNTWEEHQYWKNRLGGGGGYYSARRRPGYGKARRSSGYSRRRFGPPGGGGGGGGGSFRRRGGAFRAYAGTLRNRKRSYRGKPRRISRGFANSIIRTVMERTVPWQVYRNNRSVQWTADVGAKGFYSTQVGNWSDFNYILTTMLGLVLPGSSGARNGIEIEKCRISACLQNNTNAPVNIIAYYCTPRFDSSVEPAAISLQGIGAGYLNIGNVNGAAQSVSNMPFTLTPFDIPNFTTNFKVYHTKKMILEPGVGHQFKIKARGIEGKVHSADLLYTPSNKHAKHTNFILFTLGGFPAHSTAAPTTIQRTASILDVTYSVCYKARMMIGAATSNKVTWDDAGLGRPADLKIEQEEGGTAQAWANA